MRPRCAQGRALGQATAYGLEPFRAVDGTHQRREVGGALEFPDALVPLPLGAARVDDGGCSGRNAEPAGQCGVVERRLHNDPRSERGVITTEGRRYCSYRAICGTERFHQTRQGEAKTAESPSMVP